MKKTIRALSFSLAIGLCIATVPTKSHAAMSDLAEHLVAAVAIMQQACIKEAGVECEIDYIDKEPSLLSKDQSVKYTGVKNRAITYFYLAVGENDAMDPDIYLYDSNGVLLAKGEKYSPVEIVAHKPEYTQKVTQIVKLAKGRGFVGFAVLKFVE